MTVVDTTVWIDYLRGTANPHTEWLDRTLGRQPIALTDLILCEVLQGVREDARFGQLQREFAAFDVLETGGKAIAVAAAQNYRLLRSQGLTVRKTVDCLIATVCLREAHSLLHRDRDFDGFERILGLRVIHP